MSRWFIHHPRPEPPDPRIEALIKRVNKHTTQIGQLMADLKEVEAAVATLAADFEAEAGQVKAEFAKLEEEVAAGKPANLEPLKASIDALTAKVKTAGGEVPTN